MTPRASGAAGRWLAILLGALVLFLLPASPAGAHALVGSSDPPDGAQLDESPKTVTISFTEPPDPTLSFIRVQDQQGRMVHQGDAEPEPGRPQTLRLAVSPLEEGVYTITWRAVSRVDGHATAGFLAFGLGVSPLEAPPNPATASVSTPSASPLEMAARLMLFVGLGLLLGSAWVGAAAFREPPRGVLRLTIAGLAVATVGLVTLVVAQRQAAGVGLGDFLSSTVGRALLLRAAAIVACAGAAVWAIRSPRGRRVALGAAAVAAAVAMLSHVAAGHAASGSLRWAKVTAQWSHFVGVGVWLGGLAALIMGVRGRPSDTKASAVKRFSLVAGIALAVVAGTGVVRAWNELGSWGDLFSTSYGRVVLIKSALLLPLVGLGALNRYRNVPAAARSLRGLRATSSVELGVAVVILGAAAVLASLVPPALVPAAVARTAPLVAAGSDFATSVQARLDIDPGVPGPNRFLLHLTDYDTAKPLTADRVALRFSFPARAELGESTLELQRSGRGLYGATGPNLAFAGPWDVTVLVQRGGDSVEVPLTLGTICRTRDIEGPPTIHILELSSGISVEGLLFPERVGKTNVHFTFTDETGDEIELRDDPVLVGWPRGEAPFALRPRRLGIGHFTAITQLEPGGWRFDIAVETASGDAVSGCFQATIG